jgi:hypothetical protein
MNSIIRFYSKKGLSSDEMSEKIIGKVRLFRSLVIIFFGVAIISLLVPKIKISLVPLGLFLLSFITVAIWYIRYRKALINLNHKYGNNNLEH